jgi:hypothetical protein
MSTRREILQALIASIGASAVVPGLAASHPFGRHLADPMTLDQADAKAKEASDKPEFLDRHQFETLQMLAERIVPGSTRAKSAEFLDQLLAVESPDDQRSFLTALGMLEGQALARANRPWKQLSEADEIAILTAASTMASGKPPARAWTKGDSVVVESPAPQTPTLTLRDHFDLLKGWIAGAYYSSEIGMRELGWTGNMFHRTYPGCEHPDGHG